MASRAHESAIDVVLLPRRFLVGQSGEEQDERSHRGRGRTDILSGDATRWSKRFAVRGLFWRQYLDWGVVNLPFYVHPVLIWFSTAFFFFFAGPARRAIVANLAVVLPGSSFAVNHLRAFRTLLNYAWTIAESATFKLTRAEFDYRFEGPELLDELASTHGAIVLTAHMGSYDLGAGLFAQKFGRGLRMVRAPEPDIESERHLQESLRQTGGGAVKVDHTAAGGLLSFDLLHALRAGEIVSIQGDRVIPGVGQTKGFLFGQEVDLPNGPFILALAAQMPIYPLFIVRSGFRRYTIIVRAPILVTRTAGQRDQAIGPAVEQWCTVLEDVTARHWHQWFTFIPLFARS